MNTRLPSCALGHRAVAQRAALQARRLCSIPTAKPDTVALQRGARQGVHCQLRRPRRRLRCEAIGFSLGDAEEGSSKHPRTVHHTVQSDTGH